MYHSLPILVSIYSTFVAENLKRHCSFNKSNKGHQQVWDMYLMQLVMSSMSTLCCNWQLLLMDFLAIPPLLENGLGVSLFFPSLLVVDFWAASSDVFLLLCLRLTDLLTQVCLFIYPLWIGSHWNTWTIFSWNSNFPPKRLNWPIEIQSTAIGKFILAYFPAKNLIPIHNLNSFRFVITYPNFFRGGGCFNLPYNFFSSKFFQFFSFFQFFHFLKIFLNFAMFSNFFMTPWTKSPPNFFLHGCQTPPLNIFSQFFLREWVWDSPLQFF